VRCSQVSRVLYQPKENKVLFFYAEDCMHIIAPRAHRGSRALHVHSALAVGREEKFTQRFQFPIGTFPACYHSLGHLAHATYIGNENSERKAQRHVGIAMI
jgi:hypothetical protein